MKQFSLFLLIATALFSCKKTDTSIPLLSLNVVNAMVDAGPVKVNYFGHPITWSKYTANVNSFNSVYQTNNPSTLNFATYGIYSLSAGSTPIVIVPAADTLKTSYSGNISGVQGDIFSLYLIGQSSNYESIFVKENFPKADHRDSTVNVRIINLCPDAPAINVTLSSSPTVNQFSNLSYKSLTEFKAFPAKSSSGYYVFQFRKSTDNTLIASGYVFMNTGLWHGFTLMFRGVLNGAPAAGVTNITNY